jgi:peptidoglycan/xylan/chitin deacetylase (PgdA/CDA1 family)
VLGVIAKTSDEPIVREFFELFKTPWEFYVHGRAYDAVLCAGDPEEFGQISAKLLLTYSSEETRFDAPQGIHVRQHPTSAEMSFGDICIPLYANVVRFERQGGKSAGYVVELREPRFVRLGYDLFDEVRILLTQGQSRANAAIPALDLHIKLLRRLITGFGFPMVEVPPVPAGASFIVCLTHDLDHPSIRKHAFDSTMVGFLYRATVWSLARTLQGRLAPAKLLKNWTAAAKLPFVYMGLSEDFWYQFDRYLELEQGRPSTFFAIPFAGKPGHNGPSARAAGYAVAQIADKVRALKDAGCEIGLHGIDAWTDAARAREEAREVMQASGYPTSGVRMHWLYNDDKTAKVLEDAGFSYDSTMGFNDTVGYRAGTAQVFRPVHARHLLELPLHVMDTAMFYPDYMNLTDAQAWARVSRLIENTRSMGGVLTINWHDRSISPERLWGDFYEKLLIALTDNGAMFLTASQAVSWFARRRTIVFESVGQREQMSVRVEGDTAEPPTAFRLRVHRAQVPQTVEEIERMEDSYTETTFTETACFQTATDENTIPLKVAADGYR